MKGLAALVLAASCGLWACDDASEEENSFDQSPAHDEPAAADDPESVLPSRNPLPPAGEKRAALVSRLRQQYGEPAVRYAFQVVDNGQRIRNSPGKQAHLYDKLQGQLRDQFPRIEPPRLFGFFDEPWEAEHVAMLYTARARVLARARSDHISLPLTFIVAALCNEGRSLDQYPSDGTSGFSDYGLDTFGAEFDNIVARGYIPLAFHTRFEVTERRNEKGRTVSSADFRTKADAFEAFIATLAHRQYLFLEDLRKKGISREDIGEDIVLFFTYKYFNGGPDSAEGLLKKRSARAIERFFDRTITYGSTGNAYVVLAGHLWLERSGAFDPAPTADRYWWARP